MYITAFILLLVIKNDFATELNSFLATLYEHQYKDSSYITYLFIPKEGVDKPSDELIKDKALITRFEVVMLKWHHQLKDVLLIQDRLSMQDTSVGITEEIEFWTARLTDLHHIGKQLERSELQNIIKVLIMAKSIYTQQFLTTEQEIKKCTAYVEDCLKFLKILWEPSLKLNDVPLDELRQVVTDILYRIMVAWYNSKFFATQDKIALIISKINNQIITRCVKYINIEKLFHGYVQSTQDTLQNCCQIIDTYLDTCLHIFEMHDKYAKKLFHFKKDDLFHFVSLFRQRLTEISEICDCMKYFGWYRDGLQREKLPLFGGRQGDEYQRTLEESQHALDRALIPLKRRSRYMLDMSIQTYRIWQNEMQRFSAAIRELDVIIVKLINETTTKTETIEQMIDILDIFVNLRQRTAINNVLVDKIRDVYKMFFNGLDDVHTQIASRQNITDNFETALPKYATRATWIRNIVMRVEKDYNILVNSSSHLSDVQQKLEAKLNYEKLIALAEDFKKRAHSDWWQATSDLLPRKLLQIPFLRRSQNHNSMIEVYFDSQIIVAINEVVHWNRLGYEIPYSLNDVYNAKDSYRQMREETYKFVRKFNQSIASLSQEESCLFQERIKIMLKKLQPAFVGKVTYMDENQFNDFIFDANRFNDQLTNLIKSFKVNHIKCCLKCTAISHQLFVKIESGTVYIYDSFVETLKSVDRVSKYLIHEMYEEIVMGIRMQQTIFKDDPAQVLTCWDHWISFIDCMLEEALLLNVTTSLQQLSLLVNGDVHGAPTPFLNIDLCLKKIETPIEKTKYVLGYHPSLEELTETINNIGKNQMIDSISGYVRLCDLFSYSSLNREAYHAVIRNNPIQSKWKAKIAVGTQSAMTEIHKYTERNWYQFRQLWEVDKESFIATYKGEEGGLQILEADIARYTEVANNINNQETIANILMYQIDCTPLKVALVKICQEWQQSLIYIVLGRLENDLNDIVSLIKQNTERAVILPKTYDDIPIYQQFIDDLKANIPRIEAKIPLISEEVALLLRYEVEIEQGVSSPSIPRYVVVPT
ncbi:unnamed protein product [Didymodactylos carnosus]|uniref:Dynein heavy chain tail domain-containing protein n=1 Tax=Didymodactylos carnosus TaxID=1234261 RepID=A0A8S2E2I0_9BILA|nr:unnamed protein product [Didymodactylos carnosus]CAF3819395.1 unnamed protein product [Didymodactylos carnosus]